MGAARRPAIVSYAVAVLAVAAAAALRVVLDPFLGDQVPFGPLFLAVTAIAFFGGLGPALLAMVLSAIIGDFLFVAPRYDLRFSGRDFITTAFFLVACGLVVGLAHRFNRSRQRMQSAAGAADAQMLAVQRERERLQQIIASIPGVVWEAWGQPDSTQQRIDYVSDYVRELLGYTSAEWVSTPNFWLKIVAPEDQEAAARIATERFKSGQVGENEFRWITKDGRTLWVLARSTVIKDESGQPVGMRGVTFDITDRKAAERQLSLLAEFSTTGLVRSSFLDIATDIARRTAEVIGDGCVIRVLEDGQLRTVAFAHRDPAAEPFMRVVAEQPDAAARSPFYADVIENRRTIVLEKIPTGELLSVEGQIAMDVIRRFGAKSGVVSPLISAGRVFGTLTLGRSDGSPYRPEEVALIEAIAARAALLLDNARLLAEAQKEAEDAQRARAAAEEAGRVKDEFLATLSHELRTPLNAILGWAHMLQDPRLPAERRQAAVETIVRNAQSQEQLIADILDVQRIMAGKIRLTLGSVDLGDIVRAAAETVQPSADAKHVRLQLLVDLDVPAIEGDADRLKQVVWNLLSNAIKFAPQDGHVQVRLLKADSGCELVVEDNGPGIVPDFIPFMFERFRQADSSTTRTHKGLGLGLAIVRSLVEMHGGTITASNVAAPGESGAIFTIRLPRQALRDDVARDPALIDHPPVWLEDVPSLENLRVLVVEDDPDARELIHAILDRCGARVTVAPSVAAGFDAFTRQRPDVIVSDIEMPQEDGYSFIKRIRALPTDAGGETPAAALTAYASPADRVKVLGAGFNIHVAKPVQPAELATVVASLAGRRATKDDERSREAPLASD